MKVFLAGINGRRWIPMAIAGLNTNADISCRDEWNTWNSGKCGCSWQALLRGEMGGV